MFWNNKLQKQLDEQRVAIEHIRISLQALLIACTENDERLGTHHGNIRSIDKAIYKINCLLEDNGIKKEKPYKVPTKKPKAKKGEIDKKDYYKFGPLSKMFGLSKYKIKKMISLGVFPKPISYNDTFYFRKVDIDEFHKEFNKPKKVKKGRESI